MASLSAVNFLFDSSSQLLPFWIAIAQNDRELELAAKARQIAYGKHSVSYTHLTLPTNREV